MSFKIVLNVGFGGEIADIPACMEASMTQIVVVGGYGLESWEIGIVAFGGRGSVVWKTGVDIDIADFG